MRVGPVKDSGSSLVPQSSQARVCPDQQRIWFRLALPEVPDSVQTPGGFWFLPIPFDIPDQNSDPQRSWLRPIPTEVPDSCLDPQRYLVPAYSLGGPRFTPRLTEVRDQASSSEVLDLHPDPQFFSENFNLLQCLSDFVSQV